MLLGVFGASLFYGDAVLTPAISVLSAVEGLEVGTAAFKPYVVPIVGRGGDRACSPCSGRAPRSSARCSARSRWSGSSRSQRWGSHGIAMHPGRVLLALDPLHALRFVTQHGWASFVVLGAVLLAFTGAEALYADMGHFGKAPIRIAWFGLVFPALMLNYFGQGALLIANPDAVDEPVLSARARLGALSDGRTRDGGDGDRVAGDDLGHLLAHQAGDPARLPAAHERHADLREGARADLHPRRELGPARRDRRGDRRVRLLDAGSLPPTAWR